jgi:hypothetical protein
MRIAIVAVKAGSSAVNDGEPTEVSPWSACLSHSVAILSRKRKYRRCRGLNKDNGFGAGRKTNGFWDLLSPPSISLPEGGEIGYRAYSCLAKGRLVRRSIGFNVRKKEMLWIGESLGIAR